MSGNETKKYVIKYHPNLDGDGGGYGVHHKRDGQIISGHPTMEQAEAAMMRYVANDKRREERLRASLNSIFFGRVR